MMPAFWIFVFSEFTDFCKGTAKELFHRLEKYPKWYIGPKTANRMRLQKRDKIVFYQAGSDAKRFLGTAVLGSAVQPPGETDLFTFVYLSEVHLWKKPVPLSKVARKLSFVRSEEALHFYFQAGTRSITEDDYRIIGRYARK